MEKFPQCRLRGTTSDFKSAYRQASMNPDHSFAWVLVIWHPVYQCPCFAVPVAQLFGSSSAPVTFCRIPDWCTFAASCFLLLAFIHCIDDIIFIERDECADVAYQAWRLLADTCGWLIPDDKSPPPEFIFRALGVMFDLSPVPCSSAIIRIAKERVSKLIDALNEISSSQHLAPAHAGQLFGQFGFSCSQFFGRWGRGMLRAFSRRQYEPDRFGLNPQIESAVAWWLANLPVAPPRRVFTIHENRPLIVTYSDGEGADAGVAIAAWSRDLIGPIPIAGFMEIPDEIRFLWDHQRNRAAEWARSCPDLAYEDIVEIEAIAPLLILHNWGHLLRGALWIHFIDNNSALGALVKGSSSVCQQELLVGHTWSRIAKIDVLPWFDRVDSKSNPVDGLSRKDFSGEWLWQRISFPEYVLEDLRSIQEFIRNPI